MTHTHKRAPSPICNQHIQDVYNFLALKIYCLVEMIEFVSILEFYSLTDKMFLFKKKKNFIENILTSVCSKHQLVALRNVMNKSILKRKKLQVYTISKNEKIFLLLSVYPAGH